jgi:hypothetical protein
MDLLELLEVDRNRIPRCTEGAVKYLDRSWTAAGRPTEPDRLAEFLDRGLKFCPTVGWRYPKVMLLRLKQLQRRQWAPATK